MGSNIDNATGPMHFAGNVPIDWVIRLHWDDADLLTWDESPTMGVAVLLLDLGPVALADLAAQLNGATPGAHLHSVISTRPPGNFSDWYRGMIDPLERTVEQSDRIKAVVTERLLGLLSQVL